MYFLKLFFVFLFRIKLFIYLQHFTRTYIDSKTDEFQANRVLLSTRFFLLHKFHFKQIIPFQGWVALRRHYTLYFFKQNFIELGKKYIIQVSTTEHIFFLYFGFYITYLKVKIQMILCCTDCFFYIIHRTWIRKKNMIPNTSRKELIKKITGEQHIRIQILYNSLKIRFHTILYLVTNKKIHNNYHDRVNSN